MRIKTGFDYGRETATIALTTNCYTDSMPLVSDIFVANSEVEVSSNTFLLGCAVLLQRYCGEQIEFENRKIGGDFAEAVRLLLPHTPTVNPVVPEDRTLAAGEIDVACFPARVRAPDWPSDAETPMVVAPWAGDFVPPGEHRAAEQVLGRYFTNAGLIADETTVSIALGLMIGGIRLRRLVVPLMGNATAADFAHVADALAVVGIELRLVSANKAVAAVPRKADQALVMLSHDNAPRVLAHFERLKREVAPLMPAYFALHRQPGRSTDGADLILEETEVRVTMPMRYDEMVRAGRRYDRGYTDLLNATIALRPEFAGIAHTWIVEYDVDFAGDWSTYFRPLMANDADLLATRVLTKEESPNWANWKQFRHPDDLKPEATLAAFMPIVRQSRRFQTAYREQLAGTEWAGHSESLIPSIAAYCGLKIEDLMGKGGLPMTSAAPMVDHFTFGFRPARSDAYFHETPENFTRLDRLYHPVKVVAQVDGKLVTREAPAPATPPKPPAPSKPRRPELVPAVRRRRA